MTLAQPLLSELPPEVLQHLDYGLSEARRMKAFRARQYAKEAERHSGVCWSGMGPGEAPEGSEEVILREAVDIARLRARVIAKREGGQ